MSYLLIVESPSKIKKIESYLGSNYKVIASCGHICKLASLKDIDVKSEYTPKFTLIDSKLSHIQKMRKEIEKFPHDRIILATDNDREGEAIAFHICRIFGLPIQTTTRIIFNEITKEALLEAIQPKNHHKINMDLVKSQQARQILDVIIGFKISPQLWKYIYHSKSNALSAGRCQTPALCLIYENEMEIRQNVINKVYKTVGTFFQHPISIKAELDKEFRPDGDDVKEFLTQSQTFSHTFTLGEKQRSTKKAPTPFNTSALLQTASNVLRYSPQVTTKLMQQLYQEGHITYIRTEAKVYSEEFLVKAKAYIGQNYGQEVVGVCDKISNKNVKLPHEAIRVTNINTSQISATDSRMVTLYKLIWKNTVQSCMKDAVYENTKIIIQAPMQYSYTSLIEIPVFLGWKKLEVNGGADASKDGTKILSHLQYLSNKIAPYQSIVSTVVERNTKSRYTESSLIRKLEELEIGRPSTYATFVDTILDKGYVKCQDVEGRIEECIEYSLSSEGGVKTKLEKRAFGAEKSKLVIEPTGILCMEFLSKYYAELFAYSYTKTMEMELDKIGDEITDTPWYNICDITYKNIEKMTKPISKAEKKLAIALDDNAYEVVFQQHGPCVRKKVDGGGGGYEYLPVKAGLKLDMDALKGGTYSLEELVEFTNARLGVYHEQELYRRIGRYGPYLEWGENKKACKDIGKPIGEITLEDAIQFIEVGCIGGGGDDGGGDGGDRKKLSEASKTILRVIDINTSIRRGKFGQYVFYKTADMSKPTFTPLKAFKGDPLICPKEEFIEWFQAQQLQSNTNSGNNKKWKKWPKGPKGSKGQQK
jgi:DNA topoisomerase I